MLRVSYSKDEIDHLLRFARLWILNRRSFRMFRTRFLLWKYTGTVRKGESYRRLKLRDDFRETLLLLWSYLDDLIRSKCSRKALRREARCLVRVW